jgi:ABC-type nitrate/sulfonate/bicarbonate transport system substrate-binding protein
MNQKRDRPSAVFMAAMPKLIYEGGRLANTTTMDYCSQSSRYSRKSPCISVREAVFAAPHRFWRRDVHAASNDERESIEGDRMTSHRMTRRTFWRSSLSLATIGAGSLVSPYARGDDNVRHGIQIGALGALRTLLPSVEKKHGLKYDVKDFRDSTAALLALDQGELDVANTTSQHLARAISEGMDVVWICGWGGGYNVLVAGKRLDLPIADDAALGAAILRRKREGKPITIGVPTGSLQHAKLSFFLKSLGIDGERDTQIVNIPFPNHPRALEAGEVDMAMTLCVFGAIAIDKGDAKLVRHLFGDKSGKQEIGFIANRKLTRGKPALVQKIVASHVEAMKTFMGNPDLRIELERKYSRLPDAVIAMQERQFLKYDYRTNVADLKTMAKELRELGWVKEDYSDRVDKYIDFTFLAKATGRSPAQLSTW